MERISLDHQQVRDIEARYNLGLRHILVGLLAHHGDAAAAARELSVSQETMHEWARELRLPRILVAPRAPGRHSALGAAAPSAPKRRGEAGVPRGALPPAGGARLEEAAALFERASHTFAAASRVYLDRNRRSRPPPDPPTPTEDAKPETSRDDYLTLLSSLASTLKDGLCLVDREGRVTFANPAAADLLGRPVEELPGASLLGVFQSRSSEDRGFSVQWCLQRASAAGEPVECNCGQTLAREDGSPLPVACVFTPMRSGDEVVGTIAVFREDDSAGPPEYPERIAELLPLELRSVGGLAVLTPREREVLELMTQGVTSDRDLAERLVVSRNTVKYHLGNILGKLGLRNRTQAVAYALQHRADLPGRAMSE